MLTYIKLVLYHAHLAAMKNIMGAFCPPEVSGALSVVEGVLTGTQGFQMPPNGDDVLARVEKMISDIDGTAIKNKQGGEHYLHLKSIVNREVKELASVQSAFEAAFAPAPAK